MTERALRGLKERARETILQEVKVTPEMRARLERRIRREAAPGAPTRSWRTGISAAVVAAAFLLVVGSAGLEQMAPPPTAPAEEQAEGDAAVPPLVERERPVRGGDTIPLTGPDPVKVSSFALQVKDQAGSLIDEFGNTILGPGPSGIPGVEARPGQKIVLNADYTLEVADAARTMQSLQEMAASSGGYVVEASLNQGENGSRAGRLLLRIPAAQFSGATAQLAGAGTVKHQRHWAQDVTDQHTDLQSRLTVLQEHEQKLQALALKAANFDEWLRLAREINEVRTQLEKLQGSLKQLENQVEYSTLNIGLIQPAPGTVAVEKGEGLWPQMMAAFGGSLAALGSLGRSLLIGLAGALPVLLPVGAVVTWLLLRRRRRQMAE